MKLVVLGTGPFAVPMFQSLLDSPHEVAALITRPTPPPRGRDKGPLNPMRDLAASHGLPIHAPESINSGEGLALLAGWKPDLLVVCDYGQILSRDVLALSPLGGINLHASLLPKYRGAAPIHWAILNGETETGVSVIHMTPRLDGGPILAVRRTDIGYDETQPDLEARLADLGIEAVQEALGLLEKWDRVSTIGTPQDPKLATKAPRLKKEQGAVDWSKSAEQIRNQVRALKPWPGSYTFWHRAGHEPSRLVVDRVEIQGLGVMGQESGEKASGSREAPGSSATEPGLVVLSDGKQLHVATGNGVLSILTLQPAGKRHMTAEEFLRGYPLREGEILQSAIRNPQSAITTTSDTPPGP
jgi:methionyl-tRNA formyltransferase